MNNKITKPKIVKGDAKGEKEEKTGGKKEEKEIRGRLERGKQETTYKENVKNEK